MKRTKPIHLDRYECGAVFESLNEKRNALLKENRPTDTVDDALLKVIAAMNKPKREKGRHEAR